MGDPRHRGANFDYSLQRKRNYGVSEPGQDRNVDDEFKRRLEDDAAQAAAEPTPKAAPSAPAATIVSPAQRLPPTPPDRFHKWAHYVIVGKDHNVGDDTPLAPGYNNGTSATTIADGYAKAAAIGAADGYRCPLIILGGGTPWDETLTFTSDWVDLIGWGQPVILGNSTIGASVTDVRVEGITFQSPNDNPSLFMAAVSSLATDPLMKAPSFYQCRFEGAQLGLYSQRRLYAEDCVFVQTTNPSLTLNVAPCWMELGNDQLWYSFFRGCRFYVNLVKEVTQSGYSYPDTPVDGTGWAIRASARPGGGPYLLTMTSSDGVFRSTSAGSTGTGQLDNGVILDDCYIYGQLLCEGWMVAHRGGAQYGPLGNNPYATVYGHDYLDGGGSFTGRQFGIVMFDGCITHAKEVAEAPTDPLLTNPSYPGGAAVFFRNSLHVAHPVSPTAAAFVGSGSVAYLYLTDSDTSATSWSSGFITTSYDSAYNIPAPSMFHPLYP